jgi:hypothetical protein
LPKKWVIQSELSKIANTNEKALREVLKNEWILPMKVDAYIERAKLWTIREAESKILLDEVKKLTQPKLLKKAEPKVQGVSEVKESTVNKIQSEQNKIVSSWKTENWTIIPVEFKWKATEWKTDILMKRYLLNKWFKQSDMVNSQWKIWDIYEKWDIKISHMYKSVKWDDISEIWIETISSRTWGTSYRNKESIFNHLEFLEWLDNKPLSNKSWFISPSAMKEDIGKALKTLTPQNIVNVSVQLSKKLW